MQAETDKSHHVNLSSGFQILWILGHLIALPLSILLGFAAIHLFSFIGDFLPEIVASGMGYILWGSLVGGIIGLLQWLLLRSKIPLSSTWIWNSVFGIGLAETMVVSILMLFKIDRNIEMELSYGWLIWSIVYLIGGFIAGYFQTKSLSKFTSPGRQWILGSTLSWGIGFLIWNGIMRFIYSELYVVFIGAAIMGIISLTCLRYIFQNREEQL